MKRRELRYIQAIVLVAASLIYFGVKAIAPAKITGPKKGSLLYVDRVIDGDTIKLSDGERVRFIGVDTPEVHYSAKLLNDAARSNRDTAAIQALGKKASDFTKTLVKDKRVRLEFDVERRDKYKRLLAYVYLEDGTFVNAKILEAGYGQLMTVPPNVKYADYFLKLEREARENRRGLWGEH